MNFSTGTTDGIFFEQSRARSCNYFFPARVYQLDITSFHKRMKRRNLQQMQQNQWKYKIIAFLLISCCLGSFVLMHMWHNRIKLQLLSREPKISFLFIARNRLSLDLVWDQFFQGAKEPIFSIFVHSRPGFVFSKATTKSAYFLGRQVNDSIQVDWGEASMIQAERILLQHALKDPLNQRFVFLSDSCIPLYNFSYIYDYIMSSSTSFVDSFADTKHGRYNPKMHPIVPVTSWRKGSQWTVLIRKHAEVIVEDEVVFPVFQLHCKYKGLEKEITRRPLTHSAWDLSASKDPERRGWHPLSYKFSDATAKLIQDIKAIDNIHYETENRREWCSSKGRPSACFLFARKFTRPAALRLINTALLNFQ
ncbi:hypothetical protein EJ110_NYTH11621 [Nymphaea thermarum]|nr:hypothetical protein EJ110_NYTH11621 [Nymphaea thermarum]